MPNPTPPRADARPLNVVIAGGGIAALETALALRDLAGDLVAMTLVSPVSEFVYWPTGVLSPFREKPPRQLALAKVAAEVGAALEQGSLESVDCDRRLVSIGGRELSYDALVIATGGRISDVLPDAITVDRTRMQESLRTLIEEVDIGSISTLAFVAPRPTWPLPAYELALLVAERARDRDIDLKITIITTEPEPLAVFGESVSAAAQGFLASAGIDVIAGTQARSSPAGLRLEPGSREVRFDRVVALPRISGPALPGLPADADGFLAITPRCEVVDAGPVYAVGDATQFPVKFGSIAAQHADAAASAIAGLAGADVEPMDVSGVVHGILLAGGTDRRLYFTARIVDGHALESRTSNSPTWPVDAKLAARYLGPYLDHLWAEGPRWVAGQLAWEATLARLESESSP
jgi:sulfide:quinone oxidoreductase